MNNIVKIALVAGALYGGDASAATMNCYIEGASGGDCRFAIVWGKSRADMTFSLANLKPGVSNIIWQEDTSACKDGRNYCTISTRPFNTYTGKALVLYSDGTYETAQATGNWEDGR